MREEISGTECTMVDVIFQVGLQWFIILWYTIAFMRRMLLGEQGIEKPVEIAAANETDVTNLNRRKVDSWIWLQQGMAKTRIGFSKFLAIGVIVRTSH